MYLTLESDPVPKPVVCCAKRSRAFRALIRSFFNRSSSFNRASKALDFSRT